MHGPAWGDREELLARTVDRLGEVVALLHAGLRFKPPHPEPVPVPRPGSGDGRPGELAAPPVMSSPAEIRAFFNAPGSRVVVTDS